MPVRTRMEQMREEKGVSRMDLVRELNLTYQTVWKWERGVLTLIDPRVLHALMAYFDCTYEDLIYEVDEE